MSMANKWKEIRRELAPEREARLEARVVAELARLPLAEVRKAREMTQVKLAEALQVSQAAISKLEQRSDMYLSTLRSYVEALGGCLEIRAIFPGGEVVVEKFSGAEEDLRSARSTSNYSATLVVS